MAISSPCRSHCSFTGRPFTRVPFRLSRSLIWNRPSSRRSKQCFRETEGSMTATKLAGSRPIVASPSGSGMVESFEGPAITSSLGRNQVSRSVQNLISQSEQNCMPHFKDFQYPNG